MKDGTTHTRKHCTSQHTFLGVLGVALLYRLLSAPVPGSWVSVAEAQLRRCLALLNLSLLIFVIWTQPVGAQPALVKDINVSPRRSSVTAIGNVLYFSSVDAVHGEELWRSNGTAAGTILVKDIWPGSLSSGPHSLTSVNGVLYFTADNGLHGRELWRLAP